MSKIMKTFIGENQSNDLTTDFNPFWSNATPVSSAENSYTRLISVQKA